MSWLDDLKKSAAEATSGPWSNPSSDAFILINTKSGEYVYDEDGCISQENESFIASANPTTVSFLIDWIDSLLEFAELALDGDEGTDRDALAMVIQAIEAGPQQSNQTKED